MYAVHRTGEQPRLLHRRDAQRARAQPVRIVLGGVVRQKRGAQLGRETHRSGRGEAPTAGWQAAVERRRREIGSARLGDQRLLW